MGAQPRRQLERLPPMRRRPRLRDEVVGTLRQALLTGKYAAGDKLGLEELADQLGVSIMPVREALITLANEGLVKAEPRRGFRAHPLAPGDLSDLFELHAHLAGILAGRAAAVATRADIDFLLGRQQELESLASRRPSATTLRRAGEINSDFHRHISKMPEGDRIRWFLRLTSRFVRADLYEFAPGMLAASAAEHPPIILALEQHDSALARKLTEEHFRQGPRLTGCVTPDTA